MTDTADRTVGFIANPMSGRDVRRLAARASQTTPEIKRDQVARAVVGAVAGGATRILVVAEPFRIAQGAVENLRVGAEIEVLQLGATLKRDDSERAAVTMRERGCGALVVLGGDGTSRAVARAWADAPMVPLSTGTNNVFPAMVEATMAGAAAGIVASGMLPADDVARRVKVVRVEIDDEPPDLALVDAAILVGDRMGNLMPFEPEKIHGAVLARAEPASVGISPIGGLLLPCGADAEFGVHVRCVHAHDGGRPLLVPISPGLYRTVHVERAERIELGQPVEIEGPAILAFDGDRERELRVGQKARLRVVRDGPRVIDVQRTFQLAAERALFENRGDWQDALGELGGVDCC